ncbi:cytochrome ubiquinol oxidase subunit I [Thermodesulforhabdus norvegica]|uniref:Cytochrome bd-I ubiquinol oxidase subunit 1 apoprotein n=1 Tax=Thermodesulforhabdus norvegica TaxID=39841 RepID=A0A1I4VYA4_9BACT|nr:cytochrome ubiquinol oxidase subunit I [Thermodesulforhabdus norvegica]SFN06304.1 cytochrome bd-I ubiquinol oxidase subunit 1 apoprotein [Thermodesulforhabdus norvegica]
MDTLLLSRLQFAAATYFHFLFVPLTLGLSILIALMETRYARTGDEVYRRMARFWGKIFLVNFAVGVVTGITLEFQFGTNWARYSKYVGDVFGSLLAIEASVAFFLESTFIAVWAFGWNRLSPRAHAISMWLVAAASNISAFWILTANAWMQRPVGYVIRGPRAELENFWSLITNSFALHEIAHTLAASYILTGFFVAGVSAYYLLKKQHLDLFKKSFALGISMALIFSVVEVLQGHMHGAEVARYQPTKLAAMESFWETKSHAPQYLFIVPDEKNERNLVEFGAIPGALSMLAYHSPDATVKGLKDFPKNERPPVTITFIAFRTMIALGFLFPVIAAIGWLKRKTIELHPGLLKLFLWMIPLPYIAAQAGWTVAEVGRQPWVVYGLMRTADAVSPIDRTQVILSFVGLVTLYTILGAVAVYLMIRFIRKGPEAPESN